MAQRPGKNTLNRVINLALYLLFCAGFGIGLLLWYGLPSGQRSGARGAGRAEWLGLNRHEWGDVHLYVMLAFASLCVLHLWLNRIWLVKIAAKGGSWKLWGGLLLGVAVIASFALAPLLR